MHLDPAQEAILRNLDGTRRLGEFRTESDLLLGDTAIGPGFSEDVDLLHFEGVYTWDKAIRLTEFLLGNADSRSENRHTLSLDVLQDRHREAAAKRAKLDDADTGMIGDDAPTAVLDVEGIETKPTPEPAPALEENSADTP